jgi:hypothetical protein
MKRGFDVRMIYHPTLDLAPNIAFVLDDIPGALLAKSARISCLVIDPYLRGMPPCGEWVVRDRDISPTKGTKKWKIEHLPSR